MFIFRVDFFSKRLYNRNRIVNKEEAGEMIKRVICVLSVFCIMFGFAGCTDKEEEKGLGTFYSLQEAYDASFITRDNLMHIAHFASGEVLDS